MPLNYEEIEVKYTTQSEQQGAGLGSDGEMVQAVSETHPTHGAGSGKVNVDGLAIMKHVDTGADAFEFHASTLAEDVDHTPIPILHCPSNPPADGEEKEYFNITLANASISAIPDPIDTFLI